jgi:hypothetical protein
LTNINELDLIKTALADLAENCHISEDKLAIDYSLNLDAELHGELDKLTSMAVTLRKSLAEKDMVAVKAALVMSRIYAMNLRNFFEDIFDDIEMIGWSDNYDWPSIPENYQIPEKLRLP